MAESTGKEAKVEKRRWSDDEIENLIDLIFHPHHLLKSTSIFNT